MAKILIVDDEPRIRELIREHLQYAGYVCEEAGDGSAALSLLSGGGYDLVILDLMMPFMDGMTCLREMRGRLCGQAVLPPGAGSPGAGRAQPHHAPHRKLGRHHDLWGADH